MSADDLWPSQDPLGEALRPARMSGAFCCRSELTAPWGLALPPMVGCLWFHIVTAGGGWLEVEGGEECRLEPGAIALVPHGAGHRLRSAPKVPATSIHALPRETVAPRYEVLRHGGGGEATRLICGGVSFSHPAARNLVARLPRLMHVEAAASREADGMHRTLELMAAEAVRPAPGGELVITRLADILVIQAIRSWMATAPEARTGWLGALGDRWIGRALSLIHRDPARPWTVASLAREVAMSRSAFAARFTRLVGEPVMRYVARWRMQIAQAWLAEEKVGVGDVAARLGYRSEAAFSRAFRRGVGVSPGAARRSGGAIDVGPGGEAG